LAHKRLSIVIAHLKTELEPAHAGVERHTRSPRHLV
jgi:hypothetical protein